MANRMAAFERSREPTWNDQALPANNARRIYRSDAGERRHTRASAGRNGVDTSGLYRQINDDIRRRALSYPFRLQIAPTLVMRRFTWDQQLEQNVVEYAPVQARLDRGLLGPASVLVRSSGELRQILDSVTLGSVKLYATKLDHSGWSLEQDTLGLTAFAYPLDIAGQPAAMREATNSDEDDNSDEEGAQELARRRSADIRRARRPDDDDETASRLNIPQRNRLQHQVLEAPAVEPIIRQRDNSTISRDNQEPPPRNVSRRRRRRSETDDSDSTDGEYGVGSNAQRKRQRRTGSTPQLPQTGVMGESAQELVVAPPSDDENHSDHENVPTTDQPLMLSDTSTTAEETYSHDANISSEEAVQVSDVPARTIRLRSETNDGDDDDDDEYSE
ncbi:hypothetical protein HDU93_003678, partial [Gonapodya sp. JEL0774]